MPKLRLSALTDARPGDALPDAAVPGLRYRARPGGVFAELRYKAGDGRWRALALGPVNVADRLDDLLTAATERADPDELDERGRLLKIPSFSLDEVLEPIRALAHEKRRGIRAGQDPRRADTLSPALDAYDRDLERRMVVKRGEVVSLLRRELLKPLGNVPLADLTHAKLVQRFRAVEDNPAPGFPNGRPGTARELRTRTNVFLGWCRDEGLITANPLAGSRRQRATRAERLKEHRRALADWELPILWRAAVGARAPIGAYLLTRLLTGQRRTETAGMRWQDVDLAAGVWTIPAPGQKSGRVQRVPLPPLVRAILRAQQPDPNKRTGLVFPGRGGVVMSGWSKTLRPVYAATAAAGMAPWQPGDLRKTLRSGLGELGVPEEVAELMVAHGPRDEPAKIYNRADRWPERVAAARRWALHVCKVLQEDRRPHRKAARNRAAVASVGGNVVPLRRSA